VVGLLAQNCLDGWSDGGVFCQRPTYTRPPTVGIQFRIRDRKHAQQDQVPQTCDMTGLSDPADVAACQSMLCLADESIATGTGGDFCVSRCRDSYTPGPNGTCTRAAGGTDLNGNPFTADSYTRRNPMLIDWTPDLPTVSLSDWATFNADAAVDVAASVIDKSQNGTSGITIGKTNISTVQTYNGSNSLAGGAGAWMNPDTVPITTVGDLNGQVVYLAWDGTYTRMMAADGTSRYLPGNYSQTFDASQWGTYWVAGGKYYLV